MIQEYNKFILEKNHKEIGTKNAVTSSVKEVFEARGNKETHQEFAENRLAGATKIAKAAKEKGGDALLTYHHFHVKLPYYQKRVDGKLDMKKVKKEYDDLLTDLYEGTRNSMTISQVAFQELVGKIEVLGELLIENK